MLICKGSCRTFNRTGKMIQAKKLRCNACDYNILVKDVENKIFCKCCGGRLRNKRCFGKHRLIEVFRHED